MGRPSDAPARLAAACRRAAECRAASAAEISLDHTARNRMRLIATLDQPRDPKGAVDDTPPMAFEIAGDEKIAGKTSASTVLRG